MTACLEKASSEFPSLANLLPLHKWSCWQDTFTRRPDKTLGHLNGPSSPEWPKRGVKKMSGHFQALTDEWMGWWRLQQQHFGSKPGSSYKSEQEFLSFCAHVQLWRMWREEKGKLLFYCRNNVSVINPHAWMRVKGSVVEACKFDSNAV